MLYVDIESFYSNLIFKKLYFFDLLNSSRLDLMSSIISFKKSVSYYLIHSKIDISSYVSWSLYIDTPIYTLRKTNYEFMEI